MAKGRLSDQERRDKQQREDMEHLLAQPQFRRFLWRVIQSARIFQGATDGSELRAVNDGRRDLGLEILAMVETGQPIPYPHPDGPLLTLLMALRAEIEQPQPNERKTHEDRFDRTDELHDDDEPEGDADPA